MRRCRNCGRWLRREPWGQWVHYVTGVVECLTIDTTADPILYTDDIQESR